MILIFDLDRTIIDTEKFKRGLSKIFGISLKEYDSHVDLFFRKQGNHYSPESHIKILRKLGHIKNTSEEKNIGTEYQKLLEGLDSYLFPEAVKTLAHLKKQRHNLILITLGIPYSQRKKINGAGIRKYFENIIYETKDKSKNKFIKRLTKLQQNILIINDSAKEALAMQKTLGKKAKIFLVKGPHAKNIEHKEKIYNSISELNNAL